jgi:hypothetical protein
MRCASFSYGSIALVVALITIAVFVTFAMKVDRQQEDVSPTLTPTAKNDAIRSRFRRVIDSSSCRSVARYPLTHPLLSVVFTSQGGTFGDRSLTHKQRRATFRILKQLWWLSAAADRASLDMEIIVVDWPTEEPTPFRERLMDAMARENVSFPSNVRQLRVLEVPKSMLRKELAVLEYFGKNIGTRRAFGEYILLGGSDSLPHEGIFPLIKQMEKDADLLRYRDESLGRITKCPEIVCCSGVQVHSAR